MGCKTKINELRNIRKLFTDFIAALRKNEIKTNKKIKMLNADLLIHTHTNKRIYHSGGKHLMLGKIVEVFYFRLPKEDKKLT